MASICSLTTSHVIEIDDYREICWVNVDGQNNQDNFTIVVPKTNLDTIIQSLEVIETDCSNNPTPQFWF